MKITMRYGQFPFLFSSDSKNVPVSSTIFLFSDSSAAFPFSSAFKIFFVFSVAYCVIMSNGDETSVNTCFTNCLFCLRNSNGREGQEQSRAGSHESNR